MFGGLVGTALLLVVLYWVVLGAIIGWVAGSLMHSHRGFLGNAVIGIVGSIIGGIIGRLLGLGGGIVGLILAVVGAMILIALLRGSAHSH